MKNDTIKTLWLKYRYAAGVLLLGFLLLYFPGKKTSLDPETAPIAAESVPCTEESERRLQEMLSKIKGVGEVRVLLSYETSEERLYTKDDGETVLVNTGSGKQEALEKKVIFPVYQGAVIACAGAENAAVRMRVIEAVHQFTGLRTDQISVLPLA